MQAIIIFSGISLALFSLSFFSKKRFGILGLALAAGAIISEVWAYEIILISGIFKFGSISLNSFVLSSLVILLPSLLLMLSGSSYKSTIGRILGSLAFTLLALAFLSESMTGILPIDGSMKDAYLRIVNEKGLIIGAGLILATLEVFFVKSPKIKERRSQH
jgi:hypothetical protein